jgi:hypothetical protein
MMNKVMRGGSVHAAGEILNRSGPEYPKIGQTGLQCTQTPQFHRLFSSVKSLHLELNDLSPWELLFRSGLLGTEDSISQVSVLCDGCINGSRFPLDGRKS